MNTQNILLNKYLYTNSTKEEYGEWYKYNSINSYDDVKHIIITKLTNTERTVLLLYAELGNYREVAKQLNVSLGTAYTYVKKIRTKIKEHYGNYLKSTNNCNNSNLHY